MRCRSHLSLCFIASLSIFSFACHADGAGDNAKAWFITSYAPLWEDLGNLDPELITDFWVDGFRDHPVDEDSSLWENSVERWRRNIERFRAEGMTGSTLVQADVKEINEHAVIIRAKWRDRGTGGQTDDSYYCGTYIAGTFQGKWKFTNYFTVECKDP